MAEHFLFYFHIMTLLISEKTGSKKPDYYFIKKYKL